MSIYQLILDELADRQVYKHEVYAPFFISSMTMHMFNLYNQRQQIYWESKRLPNLRAHTLFVAPPGYMKSYYLGTMAGDVYSIFAKSGIIIGKEQYMTEAAFVGTMSNIGGMAVPIEGAAKQYADGVIVIDEFSAITKAMQMQHSNQLDNQLLSALDHGHVIKRLGSGKIEYDTRLTLWAGVQPARFDLTSGMGRRLIYLNFIPTKLDNEYLLETVHNTRNIRPDKQRMEDLWTKIRNFKADISKIKRLEFDDSVLRAYKELKLFSYEGSYFDRLLIGYHLAQYGPEPTVTITMNDPEIRKIVEREKKWRSEISTGIEYVQLLRIIELAGGCIKQSELVIDAAMYGWNALQVLEMINDMKKYRMLKIEKGMVEIL